MSCEDYFCPFTKQRCRRNCPFYSEDEDDCLLAMACYRIVEKLEREYIDYLKEQRKRIKILRGDKEPF